MWKACSVLHTLFHVGIFKKTGMIAKPHGNVKWKPKHTITDETEEMVVEEMVVTFIKNYATQHAVFLPDRWSTQYSISVQLLPTSETKAKIYLLYSEACAVKNIPTVSLVTFQRLWRNHCSDIIVMKPKSDICKFCQVNFTSYSRMQWSQKTDDEKQEIVQKTKDHLDSADAERAFYCDQIHAIKDVLRSFIGELTPDIPQSYVNACHCMFDMAQLVMLPHLPLQPGPIFFLCGFKVCIFDVMSDTLKKQYNYLIPESVSVSKGSSYIISMLHNCLSKHSIGERELWLHTDNCVWQNKNNAIMSYFNYRILTGMNDKILLSFMFVGHEMFLRLVLWPF